jgi:hypothetical protein
MKRVAAERRLPIEDIKRAVNEVARGAAAGGGEGGPRPGNLPARPPGYDPNPDELRQGQGILEGEATRALLQHVYASVGNPVLPQELRVHQGVTSNIGAVGAETKALSIDTQAAESIRAIEKRDADMQVARKQQESIASMFSLKNAGKAASAVGKGAHFLGANVLLPVAQAALAVPGAVIQGSATLGSGLDALADAAGAAREGVNYMMEDSQVVKEARARAMPYTHALEEARYEVPIQDDSGAPGDS